MGKKMETKPLKIDPLDASDRLDYFTKQGMQIPDCVQDIINQKPFGDHPFYLFCHPRTDDDGVRKRYIWSPWIWKPRSQSNSALYKAYPGTDIIKIIWIIPPREMWNVYQKGMLFENEIIINSTYLFDYDIPKLESPEPDDPSPERAQEIAFEYQTQLFKRESLPKELQPIWDHRMAVRARQRSEVSSPIGASLQAGSRQFH
jgi:hypothetical protein